MIDDSDGDFVLLAGGGSLLFVVVAIVLYVIAAKNADECAKRTCRAGMSAHLVDHECLCTEVAK